jgi:4-amino-4-deoxy-L-arabinose transferase-like glycosyltransferase
MNRVNLKKHAFIIVFLLFYFFIIFYKLTSHPTPFYDWDESIYIQVGKEMIQNKTIIPTWQGTYWLEKPPLIPFIYGLVTVFTTNPEVSTRLLNLLFSVIALLLIYTWVLKISNNKIVALLTVVFTSFNPIFLQRSHVVNTDVFLLIGWLGYILFFRNFWLGLFFLFLGVFSKSLLGFYPAVMIFCLELFRLLRNIKNRKESIHTIKIIFVQTLILSFYYILMFYFFKNSFLQIHFTDHLFRRITSSIESHFGKRTFYIDILIEQYSFGLLLACISIFILFKKRIKKTISDFDLLTSFFILPFFIFLNVTKTKITWYLYPVIPQIAFLLSYIIVLFRSRITQVALTLLCIVYIFYQSIVVNQFFNSYYSQVNEYHFVIKQAKQSCSELFVLVDPIDRKTYETLQSMNLLVSTSKWYSSKPSIVYYFGKSVTFLYYPDELKKEMISAKKTSCFMINQQDTSYLEPYSKLKLLVQKKEVLLFINNR